MTTFVASMLLAGLGLTLILAAVSIFLFQAPTPDGPKPLTRFFLVALRLSIGWHFFVEGMDKLHNPTWSSEPYLREATGPLAPFFRDLAGDRLIDKLTLERGDKFPADLDVEWQAYLDAFTTFYELTDEQAKQAKIIFDQAKSNTAAWLKSAPKEVVKISEYPPPLKVMMTIPERLKEYAALEANVREVEEVYLPKYGAEAFSKLKTAKANLARWRAELKFDLDQQTAAFKQALRDRILVDIAIKSLPAEYQPPKGNPKDPPKDPPPQLMAGYHQLLLKKSLGEDVKLTSQAAKTFEHAIDRKIAKADPNELLPTLPGRPVSAWSLLDWSDFFVKWGITLTGALLLLGLLTRTSCVAGACLLLMFFLAMPPLPGWPESPRAEGHYWYINKNIVEMLALLTLATTRSGRWAGLDGLFQFLRPGRWRNASPSGTLEKVEKVEEMPTLAAGGPETK
jgi:uncharacterized membrane protein YphA (DoxX/SURF4 family)